MSRDSDRPVDTAGAAERVLAGLLADCTRLGASDVHLAPGLPPYFRIHGVLEPRAGDEPLSAGVTAAVADRLAAAYRRESLDQTGSLDGALSAGDGTRFRFNVYRRQGGMAVALRRLEDRFRSLAELGLPESLGGLCEYPDGLILVCGPTGAGKSTTLATLLDRINRTRACHVVTIEDPVEYVHRPLRSLINQRQVGADTSGFYEALVASLRQDPDVILVGEIRDLNTIRTAITAAETGHLVLTTVHAGDCVGTVERLVSVFPADEQDGIRRQLGFVLRAVVAQHLLIADGPAGKPAAGGPRPRVVASEILMVTPAVANLVATGKSGLIYSAMETGAAQGMQTLEQDLARLCLAGLITEGTALGMTRNPTVLKERLALRRSPPAGTQSRHGGTSR